MLHPLSRRHLLVTAAALGIASAGGRSRAAPEDPLPATARLNGWLETRYDLWLSHSPMEQSYLGLKTNADKWDDIGEPHLQETQNRVKRELDDLRANFHPETLSPAGRLSFELYADRCENLIAAHEWRHHHYPVNQLDGWQQEILTFLMNIHNVDTVDDAGAYISRLHGVGTLVDQVIEQMRLGESVGVLAPRFAYTHALRDCRNLLVGAPFDASMGGDSPLWADITAKIENLPIGPVAKQRLRTDAVRALVTSLRPAFLRLIAACEAQESRAGSDDGVWRLPDGQAYYAHALAYHTTTGMTADEVHAFGLGEVERIHAEMRTTMRMAGFGGDLTAFFRFLKEDPQFYYPQSPAGKAAYIRRTEEIMAAMAVRLDEVFGHKPRTPLVVKPVEAFREQSATAAFYQSPGAYDNRPGTYYVNTFDMKVMSKFEMESLAYHEGIPGHHMQVAIAQEKDDLPRFRRFASYTAYDEGWGLYSERLAKEMGFYQDPYSDFGRLTSELWRACRLVVDTGIHMDAKRWTRAQAITYLTDITPNSATDIANSVERYIVDPGQATAYTVGMNKILAMRADAKETLGERFDIRAFHDVALGNASVPLSSLQTAVDAWVRETAGR